MLMISAFFLAVLITKFAEFNFVSELPWGEIRRISLMFQVYYIRPVLRKGLEGNINMLPILPFYAS